MKEQSHCDVAQGEGGGGGGAGGDLKLFYHVCSEAWLPFLLGAATATLQGEGGATVVFCLQIMALIQVTVQRCIAAQDRPAKSTSGDSTKVSRPLIFF